MSATKLQLSALFVAFDTEDLKCKIKTCENLKAKCSLICWRHYNAKNNYDTNPSIANKKFLDEFLEYQKQKKLQPPKPPKCTKCGETDKQKFFFVEKKIDGFLGATDALECATSTAGEKKHAGNIAAWSARTLENRKDDCAVAMQ